jgi:hypothetical protein
MAGTLPPLIERTTASSNCDPRADRPQAAKRRREKRSSFDDGEMPSRSSSAVRLISSGSRADQHPGHVSSFLNC